MRQQDINTVEMDLASLMQMNPMQLLDILHDIDFLEILYINDKVVIQRKDELKEEFNV